MGGREMTGLKLNIGCGKSSLEGFEGIDIYDHGQKFVCDVRSGLPFANNCVDGAVSSHFVEHLTGDERIEFFNELYRVMKDGATAKIVTPHFGHACAYGDPTHQWPPMSEWYPLYLNKEWRDVFAPHVAYNCDFSHSWEVTSIHFESFDLVNLVVDLTCNKHGEDVINNVLVKGA
jgi:SAM-dependent methyltransferase